MSDSGGTSSPPPGKCKVLLTGPFVPGTCLSPGRKKGGTSRSSVRTDTDEVFQETRVPSPGWVEETKKRSSTNAWTTGRSTSNHRTSSRQSATVKKNSTTSRATERSDRRTSRGSIPGSTPRICLSGSSYPPLPLLSLHPLTPLLGPYVLLQPRGSLDFFEITIERGLTGTWFFDCTVGGAR